MQRKKIDRDEYEAIKGELTEVVEIIGTVITVEGRHEDHGAVILIRQAGRVWADPDDVSLIRAKGEPGGHHEPERSVPSNEARGIAIGIGMGRHSLERLARGRVWKEC